MQTPDFETIFKDRTNADNFCRELKDYYGTLRSHLEKMIVISGLIVGILAGIGAFKFVPENWAYALAILAGIAVVSGFIGFNLNDNLYGWAVNNKLTEELKNICSDFGVSYESDLNNVIDHVLGKTDMVKINASHHSDLDIMTFECRGTGEVSGYIIVTSVFVGGVTYGFLSWLM